MTLPLLQLRPSSRPALDDDDELQESTEGPIANLLLRGKRSKQTKEPREDYNAKEWKIAARNVFIAKLPTAFGGRMLRFQMEPTPTSSVAKYTLRVGVGENENAKFMLIVRPKMGAAFRATYHKILSDDATDDGELLWTVEYATSIRSGDNEFEYHPISPVVEGKRDESSPALKMHEFVGGIVDTVVEFVRPRDVRTAPNDFELAYDDRPGKRTLSKFLLGGFGK